jgi:DNA helicase TIP49 (TBP-interacting protein)
MKKLLMIAAVAMAIACTKKEDVLKPIAQSVQAKALYLDGINTQRMFFINQQMQPQNSTQTANVGDVIEVRNSNHMGELVGAGIVVDGVTVVYEECECPIVLTYVIQ